MTIRRLRDEGFSFIELMIAIAIIGSIAAISVPISGGMIEDIRLRGDAHGLASGIALTKMTAATKFARSRLRVNITSGTWQIETWQSSPTPGWALEGGMQLLSEGNAFGAAAATTAPPNSQTTVGQPAPCLTAEASGSSLAGTACVIFNSRGIPISSAGTPATTQVLYVQGPTGVFAIVVGGTGQLQVWRTTLTPNSTSHSTSSGTWHQQ